MSVARKRGAAIHAVLFTALSLLGCSDESDGSMSGALAGAGAAAGGGAGGATGGTAGAMVPVGGMSGGVGGAAGATGGAPASGGVGGGMTGGSGGAVMDAGVTGGSGGTAPMDAGMGTRFSFFVTSYEGMMRLANEAGVQPPDQGFGGDLGGLPGADEICQKLATAAGDNGVGKTWRAFLSTVAGGEGGGPVHAIDRIGDGPWYDANDRLVAENIAGLLEERPAGDPQSVDDLPDELGAPTSVLGDSHDVLTGSGADGRLAEGVDAADTCMDWTFRAGPGSGDQIMCGHSWPRCAMFGGCDDTGGGFPGGGFPGGAFGNGSSWVSDHPVAGCKPGVNFVQDGPGDVSTQTVGAGGGYGAIYCFAILAD
jgi:hypothetical protein